jgi:hypothetical protein
MQEKINILIEEGIGYTFQNNCFRNGNGTFSRPSIEMQTWIAEVEDFLVSTYGKDSSPWNIFERFDRRKLDGNYADTFDQQKNLVLSALKSCLRITPKQSKSDKSKDAVLRNLFDKFHDFVKQLRHRYDRRPTFDVNDEYDVQDLIHALLKLNFSDIRKEEWTPSYAGGSSRMDFLLKEEKIVIEVKKTRKGLGDKELGKQLIEDKERYKSHPDCKKLICFTYDPEGRITNPKGLENDLNRQEPEFEVEIIIKP